MNKQTTKPKTHFIIAVDRSGSIEFANLQDHIVKLYNNKLALLRSQDEHNITVSLILFSNAPEIQYQDCRPSACKLLTRQFGTDDIRYVSGGMTVLKDTIVRAIKLAADYDSPETSTVIDIITDGEDEGSMVDNLKLGQCLSQFQSTGRGTLAIQMPAGYVDTFIRSTGITKDNICKWEQTPAGAAKAACQTQVATSGFLKQRAAGVAATTGYYRATTDLSGVTEAEIKKRLEDLTDRFKVYTVKDQTNIKDFVESKTKQPYVTGQAMYLLAKKAGEKIQEEKSVCLVRKQTKRPIWGGAAARELVGLKPTGTGLVKPGNHADYDVFIQSRAPNRILPRDTVVLIDVKKVQADHPTWTPEAIDDI